MTGDLSTIAQQKSAPIVLRFPEKCQAHGPAKNSHKAIILFFPHQVRTPGIRAAMSQQRGSDPGHIAKWLIFKVRKVADNDWQVRRLGSRDESHYVACFKSEGEALEWIAGDQADRWLKQSVTRRGALVGRKVSR
jgi:hypothetical protein